MWVFLSVGKAEAAHVLIYVDWFVTVDKFKNYSVLAQDFQLAGPCLLKLFICFQFLMEKCLSGSAEQYKEAYLVQTQTKISVDCYHSS